MLHFENKWKSIKDSVNEVGIVFYVGFTCVYWVLLTYIGTVVVYLVMNLLANLESMVTGPVHFYYSF